MSNSQSREVLAFVDATVLTTGSSAVSAAVGKELMQRESTESDHFTFYLHSDTLPTVL